MAVEAKRGCGYRKVGGLYLVAEGAGMPCCKMPLELSICPCCGAGIKQTRGWTWVNAGKLFPSGGCVGDPLTKSMCPAVNPAIMGTVGLLWIGEKFYPRPVDFLNEAARDGISRRLAAVPRNFKAGKTWVLFAHPKAIEKPRLVEEVAGADPMRWKITDHAGEAIEGEPEFDVHEKALSRAAELDLAKPLYVPGVIRISKPRGFEKIVKQSTFDRMLADRASWEADEREDRDEHKGATLVEFEKDSARGVKWIAVPDDDKDHQGTVYDKEEEAA